MTCKHCPTILYGKRKVCFECKTKKKADEFYKQLKAKKI
jgi:RNA polymerase subunit RPABC4/transcription elongation factor Spt4